MNNFSTPPLGVSRIEQEAITIFIPYVGPAEAAPPQGPDSRLWSDYTRLKTLIRKWEIIADRTNGIPFAQPHPLVPTIAAAKSLALRLAKQLQSQMRGD